MEDAALLIGEGLSLSAGFPWPVLITHFTDRRVGLDPTQEFEPFSGYRRYILGKKWA